MTAQLKTESGIKRNRLRVKLLLDGYLYQNIYRIQINIFKKYIKFCYQVRSHIQNDKLRLDRFPMIKPKLILLLTLLN